MPQKETLDFAMKQETNIVDDQFIISLSEDLSFADQATFREVIDRANESGKNKCVFELNQLVSIDSSGLGMFLLACEEARKSNWSLVLRGAQGQVKRMLTLCKFDEMVLIEN